MKKMFILVMTVMLCFTLTACNEEGSIDFPFELSSIENVEMFCFTIPADAEKKVITKSEDIEEIYQTFESVSLKDKTTEPTAGGSVTSFRFNLSDGPEKAIRGECDGFFQRIIGLLYPFFRREPFKLIPCAIGNHFRAITKMIPHMELGTVCTVWAIFFQNRSAVCVQVYACEDMWIPDGSGLGIVSVE